MFSLEAPQSKRQHGSPALASLTDSLHLQQPVWHSSKVQVAAPRMSAKRVPRQQLRVANTSTPGPPIFLLTQHHRGLQAVLGFREQVNCFVLSLSTILSNRLMAVGLHLKTRHSIRKQRLCHEGLKLPWRRKTMPNDAIVRVVSPDTLCQQAIEQGLAAEHAMDMRKAVLCFEEVTKQLPKNAHYRSMLSKQWTDCTYLDVSPSNEQLTDDNRRQFNISAMEHAKEAIELDDTLALPHIAACTSMGRLALLSDNKTKVRLAHDAREEAVTALALEPSNDLAHHLMGRWHYEMANLNVVVRTLVRVMYGTALAPGSHHDALESYQTAVSLAPARLIHRVELGRTLDRLGRKEQARQELEAALELDVEDINAFCQRQDALSLLKRMPKAPPRVAATPTGMDTDMSASDVCDSSSSPDTTAGIA